MTSKAREILIRIMWRNAQDYGRTIAEIAALEREFGHLGEYRAAQIWKLGTYAAWWQVKNLIDYGQVKDPWRQRSVALLQQKEGTTYVA